MINLPIRYFADCNPGTGWNNALRGYLAAFSTLGIDATQIRVVPAVAADLAMIDDGDPIKPYLENPGADDMINIVHLPPHSCANYWTQIGGRYNIAITAWETDRLPARKFTIHGNKQYTAAEGLNLFDEIWVPSAHNKAALVTSGVTKPVYVIPHALLPELLTEARLRSEQPRTRVCTDINPKLMRDAPPNAAACGLYTIGTYNERKNIDGLMRAYFGTEWSPKDPVELSVHCVPPTRALEEAVSHSTIAQEAIGQLRKALPDPQSAPSFGLLTTYRPYRWVCRFHAQNDVFVTASNGEGFCLPALEALAMGNRCVLPSYLRDVFAPYHEAIVWYPTHAVSVRPTHGVAGYEIGQKWWAPDEEELISALQNAFALERYQGHAPEHVAERVRKDFAPAAIGDAIATRLEHIHASMEHTGW